MVASVFLLMVFFCTTFEVEGGKVSPAPMEEDGEEKEVDNINNDDDHGTLS